MMYNIVDLYFTSTFIYVYEACTYYTDFYRFSSPQVINLIIILKNQYE